MRFNKPAILVVLMTAAMMPSCLDNDLHINPNAPADVPPIHLIVEAEYQLNNHLWGRDMNAEWGMFMVQYWNEYAFPYRSLYGLSGFEANSMWSAFYAGSSSGSGGLINLMKARNRIAEDPELAEKIKANQLAIVDILTAYCYQNLTDLFGDVPYSEALNPAIDQPRYDSQQSIYAGILNTLSNAVRSIDAGSRVNAEFEAAELIYGGDMGKWKKFGHSLMLRAAMRVADADPAMATEYVQQATSGTLIMDNDDNALFTFSNDPNTANPLYIDHILNGRDDFRVTRELIDTLKAANDPRLGIYANPNPEGEYRGMLYGLGLGDRWALKDSMSGPGDQVRQATAPAVMMDAAEVHFLLAEAVQRGMIAGDAAGSYANGIEQSMNYWGISDQAAIEDYIDQNPYDASNWKAAIGLQKWLAFYMNGLQAWAEFRRLDAPALVAPPIAQLNAIPLKLPYPDSEQELNGENLSAVTSDPEDMLTKLWWDVH